MSKKKFGMLFCAAMILLIAAKATFSQITEKDAINIGISGIAAFVILFVAHNFKKQ